MMTNCREIDDYIWQVQHDEYPVSKEQPQLCEMVERIFTDEDVRVNKEQLEKYMDLQKYFPFDLFPWEKFLFALHNCTYRADGRPRFPETLGMMGRGAGKNGYMGFEGLALTTPINGIQFYHIDIFANSEDQAKTTFDDIYNVLEANKAKMEKHFTWNKEVIMNKKTKSQIRFRTSNAKTKDGGRPGMVVFDEYHQYETYKTIEVAETGLGKKPHPRKTIITTNGIVRDGPLDHILERAEGILSGELPDNGLLPFICRLDDKREVDDPRMWHKANPSLRYFQDLRDVMLREYENYKMDRIGNSGFMTRRMNRPQGDTEAEVTSWDNIKATNQEMPELEGCTCIAGIDYAQTTDFISAGLLFEKEDKWYWITHTWVCAENPAISRIRFPLRDAEERGLLTMVYMPQIPPEMPAQWLAEQGEKYDIHKLAIDWYRKSLLAKALREAGFDDDKRSRVNIITIRPSNIKLTAPVITSKFADHKIIWGDNPLMRWYTNNAKKIMDAKGNVTYGKIEPKSRKTDGFMALVAAATQIDEVQGWNDGGEYEFPELMIY
ncbi:MAG: terminase large subunit [Lachnospiraceae bacterium]|nr:terminase large subunit [Lachnospiraceae bacterium]